MKTSPAVPFNPPTNASGRKLVPREGDCIWCGMFVSSRRDEAGCTSPDDPAWATEDGDFGCDLSPETTSEGCGSHARPYDLALFLMNRK